MLQYYTHLEIPITIYTPTNVNKDKLVIYFHGGGEIIQINSTNAFIKYNRLDYLESKITSNNCQFFGWVHTLRYWYVWFILFCSATKTVWISVEYPLGPEHKYPIWLDESSEVTQHIIQNKTAYGLILFRQSIYIPE
jgi:acetyl esterase/lipase